MKSNTPMNLPPDEHDDTLDGLLRLAPPCPDEDAAFVAAVMQRVRQAALPLRPGQALRQVEAQRSAESRQRHWALAGSVAGVVLGALALAAGAGTADLPATAFGDAGASTLVGVAAALVVLAAWALQQIPSDH